MSDIGYFFGIFCFYLLISLISPVAAYTASKISWVVYTKNCLDIFSKQIKNDFPLVFQSHIIKCLIIFVSFALINLGALSINLWLWLGIGENNKYFIIPFLVIFLISYFLLFFFFKKIFKLMKKAGVYNKKIAIDKFQIYLKNFENLLKISQFELLKSNVVASRNAPFQFNQKRYHKKIKKLKAKNYQSEKYDFKLLNLYIKYLKTYAVFLKGIETEEINSKNNYSVIINQQMYNDLEHFKNIIVNNFFAFTQT